MIARASPSQSQSCIHSLAFTTHSLQQGKRFMHAAIFLQHQLQSSSPGDWTVPSEELPCCLTQWLSHCVWSLFCTDKRHDLSRHVRPKVTFEDMLDQVTTFCDMLCQLQVPRSASNKSIYTKQDPISQRTHSEHFLSEGYEINAWFLRVGQR